MGQLIKGHRRGVQFSTPHGVYRNGNTPSKEQAKYLKADKYAFEGCDGDADYVAEPESAAVNTADLDSINAVVEQRQKLLTQVTADLEEGYALLSAAKEDFAKVVADTEKFKEEAVEADKARIADIDPKIEEAEKRLAELNAAIEEAEAKLADVDSKVSDVEPEVAADGSTVDGQADPAAAVKAKQS